MKKNDFTSQRNRCDSTDSFTFTISHSLDGYSTDTTTAAIQQQELQTRDTLNLQSPMRQVQVKRTTSDYSIGITESFMNEEKDNNLYLSKQQNNENEDENNEEFKNDMVEIMRYESSQDGTDLSIDTTTSGSSMRRFVDAATVTSTTVVPPNKKSFYKIRKVASKAVTAMMKPLSSSSAHAVDGMPPRPPVNSKII